MSAAGSLGILFIKQALEAKDLWRSERKEHKNRGCPEESV